MNGLFGLELPTPVNFVIAFVVVLGLIGAATWLVRRFGATRLEAGARNRQPRLAVLDSAAVDGRRKLVIIRRDNVEHLLMIGGPTDVVVETNIVRSAQPVAREAPAVRVNGGEPLPRAMPLPDTTAAWPLQPEPAVPAAPAAPVRAERAPDINLQWPAAAEPEPAPPAEPVAAPAPPPQRQAPAPAPRPAPRPAAAAQAPAVQADPRAAAANDANLASMAHQLEAALRRPAESAKPAPAPGPAPALAAAPRRIEPKLAPVPAPQPAPQPQAAPRPVARPVTAPAAAAAASAAPAAAAQPFESLEQEMASLLGRPGKS
jgi:hypothetical protein